MYFIEGFIALADRLGMVPDDVYILGIFSLIFLWEFWGWLLAVLYRFLRWSFSCAVCWLRSRRKNDFD